MSYDFRKDLQEFCMFLLIAMVAFFFAHICYAQPQTSLTMDMSVQRIPLSHGDSLSSTTVDHERVTLVFSKHGRNLILMTAKDTLILQREPTKIIFPLEQRSYFPEKEEIFIALNNNRQRYNVTRRRFDKHKFYFSFTAVPPLQGDNLCHILVEPYFPLGLK